VYDRNKEKLRHIELEIQPLTFKISLNDVGLEHAKRNRMDRVGFEQNTYLLQLVSFG
jgi:hypothetical protein